MTAIGSLPPADREAEVIHVGEVTAVPVVDVVAKKREQDRPDAVPVQRRLGDGDLGPDRTFLQVVDLYVRAAEVHVLKPRHLL